MKEEGEEERYDNVDAPESDHSIQCCRKVEVEQSTCDEHHGQDVNQIDAENQPTKDRPDVQFEDCFQVHTVPVCKEDEWLELRT